MRKMLLTAILALAAVTCAAHAQIIRPEIGIGVAYVKDMGDGTWFQTGVARSRTDMTAPAFLLGLTGDYGAWQWHVDYVYLGQISAACVCVADSDYNPKLHKATVPGSIPFNGFGHTQGLAATLGYGVRFGDSWRAGLEVGPWLYWETWHESRIDPAYPDELDLSHKAVPQLGFVAGARIERGPYSLSYRYYYSEPQRWNPYPGINTGVHMLMLNYRF